MSLLSSVELLIKMYKEEQVQINARTEVYREILRSLTPEPNTSPDGSEPADEAAADADVSPQEKEDIELLERVLQKALRVLTSSEPSKAGSGGEKLSGPGREVSVSSAAAKGRKPTAVKSASLDRKQLRRPGSCSTLASRLSAGSRPSSSAGPASLSRNHQLRGDQSKAASGSTPSDCRELQQSRRPSEHAARWRSVRNKQNRLWDKVSAVQRRPAAGRSVFMDRLRALFPSEWPSGSPDRTRAVDRPTHQDHQDPRSRTPETASESGGRDEEFGSCETPAEVQTSAHRVEQETETIFFEDDRRKERGGDEDRRTEQFKPSLPPSSASLLLQRVMSPQKGPITALRLPRLSSLAPPLALFFISPPSLRPAECRTCRQGGRQRISALTESFLLIQTSSSSSSSSRPSVGSQQTRLVGMGCTTGHLACQPQPQQGSGQEGPSLEAGGAKVPEVLSSLERLSQATGGMEKSWYRCIFPFGIISLVIGAAGTGVTYTYNDLPQTKVVSVVLLVSGLLLLLMATACWTVHKKKRRKKKEGGSFSSEQCPL
ncbi:uncharacterized protein LOC110952034 isoform X2 [Acanthochromis polyacanthus]|uniref:uncharacterized protein LOC110952034 isoform X2 n=1 Tax=Acanthochromis polyacanthus TaxID=80966 RepID=UPI0022346073|nr:uncharacterized protein LOC110952034 isoform X2 [Acanthochromis polyacanthus]